MSSSGWKILGFFTPLRVFDWTLSLPSISSWIVTVWQLSSIEDPLGRTIFILFVPGKVAPYLFDNSLWNFSFLISLFLSFRLIFFVLMWFILYKKILSFQEKITKSQSFNQSLGFLASILILGHQSIVVQMVWCFRLNWNVFLIL